MHARQKQEKGWCEQPHTVELEMTSPQQHMTRCFFFPFSAWKNESDIFTKQKLCQII
jgi:hypothetical protein